MFSINKAIIGVFMLAILSSSNLKGEEKTDKAKPGIQITTPANKAALHVGDKVLAKGTSKFRRRPITLVLIHEYTSGKEIVKETSRLETKTDSKGNWKFRKPFPLRGQGKWTVEVVLTSNSKIKARSSGEVAP